jgi:energy-coupling factor transporter transmembrane protein EcfT
MGLLGMILAAVLVAVLLAIVIVKYLPLKYRWIASSLLLLLTVFLVFKIYNGIMEPINFNKKKVAKFAKVVKSLKIIRDAEVKHFEVTGKYTNDKAGLIQFIDSAQLALTETKDTIIKVNKGGGIIDDVTKRKKDTIGYEPVLKYFEGRDYKNMFKVPGVEGKEFDIVISTVEKVQGLIVPTFYVKTEKIDILKGMSKSLIKQELEANATDQIKGEFVSVGSLEEVSTGGNWPPSYDKQERDKKE